MGGGLIQIVSYGSQDLFLTGTPEITFFKVVYRRHTHFVMESVSVPFKDEVGFGKTASLTVPRVGDLMHRAYIDIDLPCVSLFRRDPEIQPKEPNGLIDATADEIIPGGIYASRDDPGYWERNNLIELILSEDPYNINRRTAYELDLAKVDYNIVMRNFTEVNRDAYLAAKEQYEATNVNTVNAMKNAIIDVFNNSNPLFVLQYESLIEDATINQTTIYDPQLIYPANLTNLNTIQDGYISSDADIFFDVLTIGINKFTETNNYFFNRLEIALGERQDYIDPRIKFAWIDKIGHFIIDYVEIMIGGRTIDKHYGDWINIWHELSNNGNLEEIYKKMIGDVSILKTFDRNAKPIYNLKIPLQFWFCRFSGLSIPLVSLEYHNVTFIVRFKKMEELSYIENDETVYFSDVGISGLFLDEVSDELKINIDARMSIEYIYLDRPERRKFAQSSHEYLIDQLQIMEIPNIEQNRLQCVLDNFNHPTLEIVWVSQKQSLVENINGYTKLEWDNYSNDGNNCIKCASIDFHSHKRVLKISGNYYNYVQPWQHHTNTPSNGINMYSFSLHPEEFQPSGSANFTRISRVAINFEFDETLDGPINLRIYTRSYNILRFISGMGGLAYTYG